MHAELDKFAERLENVKFQVVKCLEQHYVELSPLIVLSHEISDAAGQLSEDLRELATKAEAEVRTSDSVNMFGHLH